MSTPHSDLQTSAQDQTGLATKIDTFSSEVASHIRSLNNVVNLIEDGWKGSAHGEYNSLQTSLNDQLQSMQRHLADLRDIMRMSANGFSNQESEQLHKFRSMQGNVGPAGHDGGIAGSAILSM
jgi:WXG100 family type VII secretion target